MKNFHLNTTAETLIFDVGAAVKNIFMPAGHSTGTVKVPGSASHNSGTFITTNPK